MLQRTQRMLSFKACSKVIRRAGSVAWIVILLKPKFLLEFRLKLLDILNIIWENLLSVENLGYRVAFRLEPLLRRVILLPRFYF